MKKILLLTALLSVIGYASCNRNEHYTIMKFLKNDFSVDKIVQEPSQIEKLSNFNVTGIPDYQTNIWGFTGYALRDTLVEDSYLIVISNKKILPKDKQPITIKAKFDRQYLIDGWVDLMVLKEI